MNRVERQFARALNTYEEAADVQRRMAEVLCGLTQQAVGLNRSVDIFEFGCGSGLLTRALTGAFSIHTYLANDLVEGCARVVRAMPEGRFAAGDVEEIALETNAFDLVASAAAMQWIRRPARLLAKLSGALREGGVLAFSTFLPGNLVQIAALGGGALEYPTEESWREMLSDWEIAQWRSETRTLIFPSPEAVLRHLKATGVNAVGPARVWSRRALADFSRRYELEYSEGGGVALTYLPLYIVAKRKGKLLQ